MYLVLELFPSPSLVMNEDGVIKEFTTFEDAENEALDCQEAIVINTDFCYKPNKEDKL
jgi:hypothetical protein